jgi:hypothetical protein
LHAFPEMTSINRASTGNSYNAGMNQGPVQNLLQPRGYAEADRKSAATERLLLLIWFILNLGIGVLTVHGYGVSLDEPNNYRYAADTLEAYKSFFGILHEPTYNPTYDGHGPAFVAGTALLAKAIRSLFPTVFEPDIWHFSYFVSFLGACLCVYALAKRWFQRWTAWGILILFNTQPLLLGHAFINPKDVPFMFFFTLCIVLGFRLSDHARVQEPFISLNEPFRALAGKFQEADPRRRRRFLIHLLLALGAALILSIFLHAINSLPERVIPFFYNAAPDSWAGRLFSAVATHASSTSAGDYVTKVQRLMERGEQGLLVGVLVFFLIYFFVVFQALLQAVWEGGRKLASIAAASVKALAGLPNPIHPKSLKSGLAGVIEEVRQPRLILAAAVLGLATAVRAIAPAAGVIVVLYLFEKLRSRAWMTAVAYFLIAGIVAFLAWPRLWGSPLLRYAEGLGVLSNFPGSQRVLFGGHVYQASDLPRSYLWTLLNIQISEPVLVCVYVGLGILIWQILHSQVRTDLLLYIGLGFAAPLLGWTLLRSPLYNNFRQLLFMIPAMFVFAAFTLEALFRKLTQSWARVLIIAALALPGVYASVKLYPYEYVYYNSLAGGPGGAARTYETDYWRISLREVAVVLNQHAARDARVLAGPWSGIIQMYARPDLKFDKLYSSASDRDGEYMYTVEVANFEPWTLLHEVANMAVVERDGAVFASINAVDNAGAK